MFKYLKVSFISLLALIFVFSFSVLQACETGPGKSGCNKPCSDKECSFKVTKVKQLSTSESDSEQVVLNVKGMTCGGCESKVKGALTKCTGVKDAEVSHKDGKAVVQVEGGKVKVEELIEAVEGAGFSASEG